MKRLFVSCLVLLSALLANAQTIQLTPMELGGNYVQHIEGDRTITVSKVPEWKRTAKPSSFHSFYNLSYLEEHKNWVEIEARYFSSTSSYSLSKDSAGNVWIVYKPYYSSAAPQLYAMLDCDIKTAEDLVGDYWVSWKLIDGTKDIYPVLHKE